MEEVKKTRTSPAEFFRQVRQEIKKVTWLSRKETGITTIIVFIMVIISALFFLAADYVISHAVNAFLTF
jgi:preprotein translocase subunit SecE